MPCSVRADWAKDPGRIIEAFRRNGTLGILEITGFTKQTCRHIARKLGLMEPTPGAVARMEQETIRRNKALLERIEKCWGWKMGDDRVTLKEPRVYTPKHSFRAGESYFAGGKPFHQYDMPVLRIRNFMVANGLKWWVTKSEMIPVKDVRAKEGKCLSVKIPE